MLDGTRKIEMTECLNSKVWAQKGPCCSAVCRSLAVDEQLFIKELKKIKLSALGYLTIKKIEAPGEDRTRDLSLTKRTHYHYATEALVVLFCSVLILSFIQALDMELHVAQR